MELEEHFGPEYGPYLALLQVLRSRLLEARRGHPDNAALFRRLVDSPLLPALRRGEMQEVAHILQEILGQVLDDTALQKILQDIT